MKCKIVEVIGHSKNGFQEAVLDAVQQASSEGQVQAVHVISLTMKRENDGSWDWKAAVKTVLDI
jgi:flavin-binding protein dodecin